MRLAIRFAVFAFAFFQANECFSQPLRLWGYARYEVLSPTTTRLIDSGRFTYSGNRGVVEDTAIDLLQYAGGAGLLGDFSGLNPRVPHRYQTSPRRVETQFDTFRSWRWNPSSMSLQPGFLVAKTYVGGRLDSMHIASGTSWPYSYKYIYDTAGRLKDWYWWMSYSPGGTWLPHEDIHFTRGASGQPLLKTTNLYPLSGGSPPSVRNSTYIYNTQGRLDTLTTVEDGLPTLRERFTYDALGRLLKYYQYPYNFSTGTYGAPYIDSFGYDGISRRVLVLY